MLVAERKELAAYADKIEEIWKVSKKEGLAKGSMYGAVRFLFYFFDFYFLILHLKTLFTFSVSIHRLHRPFDDSFLWKQPHPPGTFDIR